jgi:hypothetical protein
MPFEPGQSGNPEGRKPGTQNKNTRALKEAILHVFEDLGGAEHLKTWAQQNQTEFYRIFARLTPPGFPVPIGKLGNILADQGRTVIEKLGTGELTPEQSAQILQSISSLAKVIEADELERRISDLEKLNASNTKGSV